MRQYLLAVLFLFGVAANAQIGYQISLLNNATGEPRANETVSVDLTLTDKSGATLYNNSCTATTNDFGVLSLTVGDENTFNNIGASKLPLYISASVDGILVSKSQVLSVPVAEYAKRSGVLTKAILMSKTWWYGDISVSFGSNTVKVNEFSSKGELIRSVTYTNYAISGNNVYAWATYNSNPDHTPVFFYTCFIYFPETGKLAPTGGLL